MTNLNRHIEAKKEKLDQLNQTLSAIQKQLTELQQEIRVEGQIQKAQESIIKEWEKQKQAMAKILKDACTCFEPEALEDMLGDIQAIVEEIKEDYGKYSQSDRFYNAEEADEWSDLQETKVATIEDAQEFPALISPMPPEDDNEILLMGHHVAAKIKSLNDMQLDRIKTILGISKKIKLLSSLGVAIAEQGFTHKRLNELLGLINFTSGEVVEVQAS